MFVGINGFGRIGKAIFIQLLEEKLLNVKAINAPGMKVTDIEKYLRLDSTHSWDHENLLSTFTVIDERSFSINDQIILVLGQRDAAQLDWQSYDINYVIDATGVYLTTPMAQQHNVDYVIMCAPPKDQDVTPQFIVNGNEEKYSGENVVSNASCTTNCIVPVLRTLLDKYDLTSSSFTTIHAATASQNVIDTNRFDNRTCRSVLNNIIPHSTGASKSVARVLPAMTGKIKGTSLRVPVANVSVVDMNVSLKRKTDDPKGSEKIALTELFECFETANTKYQEKAGGMSRCEPVVHVERRNLVSCDFNTSLCPSILDATASMELSESGDFKLMVWYDNEWSYAFKVIKLVEHMMKYNASRKAANPFFIENQNFIDKKVVLRLDWNVPIRTDGDIESFFRIESSLKTVQYILAQQPEYLVIVSHMGRPKKGQREAKYAFATYLEQIRTYLTGFEGRGTRSNSASSESEMVPTESIITMKNALQEIELTLLPDGVSESTLAQLKKDNANAGSNPTKPRLYLLENIRFHVEETETTANSDAFKKMYQSLGDFFVQDAFATAHRDHVSVTGCADKPRAYGYLIEKETKALSVVTPSLHRKVASKLPGHRKNNNSGERVLAIMGGGKMDDKLPLLEALSKNVSGIYIAGGNINSILNEPKLREYVDNIAKNPERANIYMMVDGLASTDLESFPTYQAADESRDKAKNFYDIGLQSIVELDSLVKQFDLIFWNGTLGVVENTLYSYGSTTLVKMLMAAMASGKKVIVGGGDTSAFVEHFEHGFTYVSTGGGASLEYLSNENGLVGLHQFMTNESSADEA